jgi:hypothetical protein
MNGEGRWIAEARYLLDEEAIKRKELINTIDKRALRALTIEFDRENGDYPEHEYEGAAIFSFFCEQKDKIKREDEEK